MNPSQNPSALRSKNEITTSLLRLMHQYPYAEISVKQIVMDAQVVRKTFYRNFNDKDDVLDSYIDSIMSEYVAVLQHLEDCRLPHVLDTIFHFCTLHKDFLLLLRQNHLLHLLLEKWNTFIPMVHDQVVDKDSAFFKVCENLNLDYILAFNIGCTWNIIVKWIENDMKESPEEIKETIMIYLKNMIEFF